MIQSKFKIMPLINSISPLQRSLPFFIKSLSNNKENHDNDDDNDDDVDDNGNHNHNHNQATDQTNKLKLYRL